MTDNKTTHWKKQGQRGVALLMALMVLLLLTALAAALVFVSNTETSVNANYRRQQVLYFASKAGIEEARDRLMASNAATLMQPTCAPASACLSATPVVPSAANGGVFYILAGPTPATIAPWTLSTAGAPNPYMDDELCHDGYSLPGQTTETSDVRCIDEPTGSAWYSITASNIPWNATAAALPYQWVRITPKLNGSVQGYKVNAAAPATTQICWDGTEEILLSGAANCTQMVNATPPGPAANPVYLLTSLAVNPISGARRMVQAEVALPPAPPFPFGLFATGTGCGVVTMAGGATTDSFTSAGGGNYATNHTNSGGDVGANGNVSMSGSPTQVGGGIGVPNATTGACPAGLTTAGGAGMLPPPGQNRLFAGGPYTMPVPPPPNPLPPTTALSFGHSGGALVPGTYGNISASANGTVIVAPGTYNIDSITLTGNAALVISPAGAVVFNVAGQSNPAPVDFTGGSISNTSGIANNFQINYAGTGSVSLSGGSGSYMILNAPNAAVSLTGNSDLYGAVIGRTISDTGGTKFHFDRNTKLAPPSTGSYSEISYRDIAY